MANTNEVLSGVAQSNVCTYMYFIWEKIKTPHGINTLVKNAHRIYSLLFYLQQKNSTKKTKNHPSIKNIQKLKYTKEKIHKEKIHSIIFSHKKENHFLWIFYTVEKKVVDFFYRCLNLFCPLMTRNRSLVNKLNTIIFSPYTLHIDGFNFIIKDNRRKRDAS